MNETIRRILAENGTKTSKIRKLLLFGLSHRENCRPRYPWKPWLRVERL